MTIAASTPSNRSSISMRCSLVREGHVSSPSWISLLVTISSGCCPQTGGRRASGRSWPVRVGRRALRTAGGLVTANAHLLDVAVVLEIFRRRQLYAKSSNLKCEFGRQELGFLGHRLSKAISLYL